MSRYRLSLEIEADTFDDLIQGLVTAKGDLLMGEPERSSVMTLLGGKGSFSVAYDASKGPEPEVPSFEPVAPAKKAKR